MSQFYANPFQDVPGFYFESFEEYEKGVEKLLKKGVEEFEIDFVDGDREDVDLWKAASRSVINQANMEEWFERIEPLETWEKSALYYLLEHRRETDLDDALQKVEDEVRPFEGDVRAYVEDRGRRRGVPVRRLDLDDQPELLLKGARFARKGLDYASQGASQGASLRSQGRRRRG